MKKEYKNFGRVKISSYIYYVIMRKDKRHMKKQELVLKEIFSERGMDSVRRHIVKNIVGDYIHPTKPLVSAIGTSGGKTWMTAARFELLYRMGYLTKDDKVLILAADKSILRSNFVESFGGFFSDVPASFKWRSVQTKKDIEEAIEDGVQVFITLPQSVNSKSKLDLLSTLNFEWLVQDEAHKWYFEKTVQKSIIPTLKPKYQSLLTGTPFKFNKRADEFLIEYTSVREMYENGYLSDVTSQVLHSDAEIKSIDYVSLLGELKESKKFSDSETHQMMNEVIKQLIKKVKLPMKGLTTTHNVTKNAASVFGKLEKTIIFTHSIPAAKCVYHYLRNMGVGVEISHSARKDKTSDEVFSDFKTDKSINVVVVVNQGKEGFDFPNLVNVIDMTFSQNFATVMQIFGRVLRKNNKIKTKFFFKVAPKNLSGYFNDWMNAMFMMFDDEWYSTYDETNGMTIPIPNKVLTSNKKKKKTNTTKKKSRMKSISHINSLEFMSKNKWFKLNDVISTVSSTTLGEVIKKHKRANKASRLMGMANSYNSLIDLIVTNRALFNHIIRKEQMLGGFDFYHQFDDYKEVPNDEDGLLDWLQNNIPSLDDSVTQNPYYLMGQIKEREINRV